MGKLCLRKFKTLEIKFNEVSGNERKTNLKNFPDSIILFKDVSGIGKAKFREEVARFSHVSKIGNAKFARIWNLWIVDFSISNVRK